MFAKKKVYAYENSNGDKGIIIAKSYDDAKRIFHEKYPKRKIVEDDSIDYWDNGSYLFEMDNVRDNELYCCFPLW